MKLVFKLLALAPFFGLAASIASKSVREHFPINAALALAIPWWMVLLLAYAMMSPKSVAEAAKRQWTFDGGEAKDWPTARATIAKLEATGVSQGKNRLVAFTLTVEDGGEPREVAQRQLVPELAFVQLRVGAPLVVHVSPTQPDQVFIDWDQSYPGSVLRFGSGGR